MNRGSSRPRKTLILAAAALGFAAALAVPALVECRGETTDPAELTQRAARHFEDAEYAQAVALFTEADQAASGRSLPAVAGLCQAALKLERHDESIAAAERRVESATKPAERARAYHDLGLGLFERGLDELYPHRTVPGYPVARPLGARPCPPDRSAGTESLRRAAEAFRFAAAEGGRGRQIVLLDLADTLLRLGELGGAADLDDRYAEAAEVLGEYADAGGKDPLADDLRCFIAFATGPAPGGAGAAGGRLHRSGEDGVRSPIKVFAPHPQYTEKARMSRIQGIVIVQVLIDEEGGVACARTLTRLAESLDAAAVDAVEKWRFRPATLQSQPVAMIYDLTVSFSFQ